MHAPYVENQIIELGPEASRIYFDAKRHLINASDSCNEQFFEAARTIRVFWRMVLQSKCAE